MSRSIVSYLRRHHLGLIAVFIALGGGAYAATQPGPDGDIDACFKKKSGQLYIAKKPQCKKGTKPISWAQEGPQGQRGPQGVPGAAGSARAYGRVGPDGTVTQASANVSADRIQPGVYCVAVAGVDATETPMVAGIDYSFSGSSFGMAQFTPPNSASSDPIGGTPSEAPFAVWHSLPDYCEPGQFEVRTFGQRLDSNQNEFRTEAEDKSFVFMVP